MDVRVKITVYDDDLTAEEQYEIERKIGVAFQEFIKAFLCGVKIRKTRLIKDHEDSASEVNGDA